MVVEVLTTTVISKPAEHYLWGLEKGSWQECWVKLVDNSGTTMVEVDCWLQTVNLVYFVN